MKDNRCVLIKGDKITVSGIDYIVDSVIGRGASCICYKAYTKEAAMSEGKPEIETWKVIKEFYPVNIAIRDNFMKVVSTSDDLTAWEKAKKRWRESIDKGRELQAKDGNDFMEIEVADDSYSVMRLRRGMTLEEWVRGNFYSAQNDNSDDEEDRTQYVVKCLDILRDLCACIEKYQDAGIIHLDVKPENIYILDDNNNKRIVRLIDYDSLMNKDEFYKIASGDGKISMYSTKEYYGEEVWSQRSDWKAAAKDENVWKQVDVYALGKVLQYMFTGNADDALFFDDNFEWFKDKDSIIERTSSRRYVLNEFINRATNVLGNRYSDAKTLKFVVENILSLFKNDNYKLFDGFNKYRDELVPELIVDGVSYIKHRGKAPIVQVFEEYCDKQNKNICIVAESGMGKSTALRKLFIDKILENQCINRYYYYPLRNCFKSTEAKSLWRNIELTYEYPFCEREYFLLDAFDETNENDEDLQDALKLRLNSLPENAAVMLTSRFEVKELRDYKIVECGKIGLTDYSDDIIRIKNNSDWLERVGIDIFQNPLFITMSENIEQIKNYIIHDKETGEKAWKKIEAELLGEYVNEKLTINYAGELIWNYVYISVLAKCVNSQEYSLLCEKLKSYRDLQDIDLYYGLNIDDETNSKAVVSCKNGEFVVNQLEDNVLIRSLRDILKANREIIRCFFRAKLRLETSFQDNDIYYAAPDKDFYNAINNTIVIWNLMMELSGAKYIRFIMQDDYCLTNIEASAFEKYRDRIYIGDKKILFEGCLQLSEFQRRNRYFLYKCINGFDAAYILFTQSRIENIDFSGVRLVGFSYLVAGIGVFINLTNYGYISFCNFSNCLIRVREGHFNQCIFKNLKESSYLQPYIYGSNYCDRVYEVTDKCGNQISKDGKYLITLIDQTEINGFNNVVNILPGALDKCVNEAIIISSNVKKIDLTNQTVISFYKGDYKKLLKKVIVYGDPLIEGADFVENIEVYDSSKYKYSDGILYNVQQNAIVHINCNLPETVSLLSSKMPYEFYQTEHCGCKTLRLPNDSAEECLRNFALIKPFNGLEIIENLPVDMVIVNKCILVVHEYNSWQLSFICANFGDNKVLYIPSDLGIDFAPYFSWGRKECKYFSPIKYVGKVHLDDNGEFVRETVNTIESIDCEHGYDFFFGDKIKLMSAIDNSQGNSRFNCEIINDYDELTEEEKIGVLEQRNKWIEYIKSLPPGKKYR